MADYYIGLGANLGDRESLLAAAIRELRKILGLTVSALSSLYETPPWGKTDQPVFYNAVVAVETQLPPERMLHLCLAVEAKLGRVRREKWGARTIDLDILWHRRDVHTAELQIPHPYLTERAFVLVPLCELSPQLPIKGKRASEWLSLLPDAEKIKKIKEPEEGRLSWKKY